MQMVCSYLETTKKFKKYFHPSLLAKFTSKRDIKRLTILAVMRKPMTDGEIKRAGVATPGLSTHASIGSTLHQLKSAGHIKCLTPSAKEGKIYTLAPKGKKERGRLTYTEELVIDDTREEDIDWNLYAYIASGSQRRAVVKVMSKEPMRAFRIMKTSQSSNKTVGRPNAYDILRCFVKKGIGNRQPD